MLPHRLGRIAGRIVPLLVLVGVVAVACTTGSTNKGSSIGASSQTPPQTSQPTQVSSDEVPTWPDGVLTPDASGAPRGVDLQPLSQPPNHRPPGDDSAPVDPSKGIDNINHLVFIVMENRSFAEYFGTYPGAAGTPRKTSAPHMCQPMPSGGCASPYHDTNYIDQGGPHGHKASVMDYDNGKMGGFIRALDVYKNSCMLHPTTPPCPEATPGPHGQPDIMGYKTRREIPNYWDYADHYTLFDHMFAPVDSWTLPSHLFLVSGWSAWCPDLNDAMSCKSELVFHPASLYGNQWEGATWQADEAAKYPRPYIWAPITCLLDKQGVGWGYLDAAGSFVTPPYGGLTGPKTADVQDPLPGFLAT